MLTDPHSPQPAGPLRSLDEKGNSPQFAGAEYLVIEVGGFSVKHPAGWKSPLIVMQRK